MCVLDTCVKYQLIIIAWIYFWALIMCLGKDLFMFYLFEVLRNPWMWMFISLSIFGKFPVIISLNHFLPISLFCAFWVSHNAYVVHLCSTNRYHKLYSLFFIPFFLWLSDFEWLVFQLTDSFFCLIESTVKGFLWNCIFCHCVLQLCNFCLAL